MSRKLLHLALECVGNDQVDDADDSGDTPAVLLDAETGKRVDDAARDLYPGETPALVREIDAILKSEAYVGGAVDKARIGYVLMHAQVDVSESDIRRGQLAPEQPMRVEFRGANAHHLGIDMALAQTMPYALSATLVGYDTRALPFDAQLSLTGMTDAEALRSCILLSRDHVERGKTCKPHALLTRPLVCHEPRTGVQFSSIEAIGFDALQLRNNVLEHVTFAEQPERTMRLAQLFGQRQAALAGLGALLDATMSSAGAASSSTLLRNFYLVPTVYEFTSLLARVHLFLTMRAVRVARTTNQATLDTSLYEVPFSRGHMVFPASELDEVIEFISAHLADAHPKFTAKSIGVRIAPFNYANWSDAWTAVVAPHDPAVPPDERRLSCSADFVIFYVSFARGTVAGDAQARPLAPAATTTKLTFSAPKPKLSYYGPLTDDEDDDDDETLEFGNRDNGGGGASDSSTATRFEPIPVVAAPAVPFPLDICTPRQPTSQPESPDTFRLSGLVQIPLGRAPGSGRARRQRSSSLVSDGASSTLSSGESSELGTTPPKRSAVIPIPRENAAAGGAPGPSCARTAYSAETVADAEWSGGTNPESVAMDCGTVAVFKLDEQAV